MKLVLFYVILLALAAGSTGYVLWVNHTTEFELRTPPSPPVEEPVSADSES